MLLFIQNLTTTCIILGRTLYIHMHSGLPVVGHTSMVLIHGRTGAHPIEHLVFLSISHDQLPAALVVAGEHSTEHHKVGTSSEGFSDITRAGTTTILQGKRERKGGHTTEEEGRSYSCTFKLVKCVVFHSHVMYFYP